MNVWRYDGGKDKQCIQFPFIAQLSELISMSTNTAGDMEPGPSIASEAVAKSRLRPKKGILKSSTSVDKPGAPK